MADATSTTDTTASNIDIFQTLQKVNQSLIDALNSQSKNQESNVSYVQQVPTASSGSSPNYMMYIGIGIVVLILIMKFMKR
jgi:hypothetical protein